MSVKKTVLEYVQACLNIMGSDSVESILPENGGTIEGWNVAQLLADTYAEFQTRQSWPWQNKKATVTKPDLLAPTSFLVPDEFTAVTKVEYDVSSTADFKMETLKFVEKEQFLKANNSAGSNRVSVMSNGYRYYVRTNAQPTCYTVLLDKYVVLDSYLSSVDSGGATTSKLSVWGQQLEPLTLEDSFTPDLPASAVQALQSALNQAAYVYLLQQESPIDARKEARQMGSMSYKDGLVTKKEVFKRRFRR